MRDILIYDAYMVGTTSSTYGVVNPLDFKWVHAHEKYGNPTAKYNTPTDVVFYTDRCIWMSDKIGKTKIAWLLEPQEFEPKVFNYILKNYNEFDYVFTWDKRLLELNSKFRLYTTGNSWIARDEIGMYSKDKLLSISASWKKFLSGHKIRHEIIGRYMKQFSIHWYGKRGQNPKDNVITPFDPLVQNPVTNLIDAYKDYMFTIVVENANMDYMFSEKLVSPILCGTIPIYYGMPSIGDFFDTRGMIIFNSVDELEHILKTLTPELYFSMLSYAQLNFEKAKEYQLLEDGIFNQLKELEII